MSLRIVNQSAASASIQDVSKNIAYAINWANNAEKIAGARIAVIKVIKIKKLKLFRSADVNRVYEMN